MTVKRPDKGRFSIEIKRVVRMAVKLTEKQRRFIDYFIETGNQTQAARRAGYKQPAVQGAQTYAKLRTQIDERLSAIEDARIADATEVLQTLTRVLRREELEQIVIPCAEKVPVVCDDGKVRYRQETVLRVEDIKPKLSDVNKAAELLGKRYGLFTGEPTADTSGVTIIDDL